MGFKNQISIIGCGWLGLPLAKALAEDGYMVKGSTTSKNKVEIIKNAGVHPFLVALSESEINGDYKNFLEGSDILVINIPPGLRRHPNKNHVKEITHLIQAINTQDIKHVLYISSISVFKNDIRFPKIVDDTTPRGTSKSAEQLIAIEALLHKQSNFKTSIIRFGGLLDEQRHPAKYLSGKNNIANPYAPVNLIHKLDCIAIIKHVIAQNAWGFTCNAVYPYHPKKKDYYSNYCKTHGLEPPSFNFEGESEGKFIDGSKVERILNYSYHMSI